MNGLEGTAAAHNDSLLALDEISQADPHQVGEAAYMLANETGKSRARRDGALRIPARWRLLFLSSGEQSMQTYLRQAGQTLNAGQLVRFVDIPAATPRVGYGMFEVVHGAAGSDAVLQGQAFADAIISGAKRYYGTAGVAYLQQLTTVDHSERLRRNMDQFKADHAPANASGQVLRVLERFAMIAAAGELASEWGITGWQGGAASHGIACCFQDWVATRGGAGLHEDAQLIESVTDFLQRFGESRFQDWNADERTNKPKDRAGYRKVATDGGTGYYVFRRVFKDEICRGHDPTKAARLLHQAGMLERSREAYTIPVTLPGEARTTRLYLLRLVEATQVTQVEKPHLCSGKASHSMDYTGYTGCTGQKIGTENDRESKAGNTYSSFLPVQPVRPVQPNDDGASEPHRFYTGQDETCVEGDDRDRGVI